MAAGEVVRKDPDLAQAMVQPEQQQIPATSVQAVWPPAVVFALLDFAFARHENSDLAAAIGNLRKAVLGADASLDPASGTMERVLTALRSRLSAVEVFTDTVPSRPGNGHLQIEDL